MKAIHAKFPPTPTPNHTSLPEKQNQKWKEVKKNKKGIIKEGYCISRVSRSLT